MPVHFYSKAEPWPSHELDISFDDINMFHSFRRKCVLYEDGKEYKKSDGHTEIISCIKELQLSTISVRNHDFDEGKHILSDLM
jgi:hypothetical protein